ncbi:MAG: deoxyribose-phosphate aldolase [Candidatus Melainabacteria bacterium RIFOXYA12_FULL_32_12]|nr:MAG: deoxyribose-phosphate aldolase [Candidatus Melainabacteria bacterium RIFOXYA2_FULL_32_9]OGI26507.1 MAG: deoxyribose-phosphate aldolase [Candidatus Melainabacteria bacterium RIFOXYA12_FULL_32_12]
MENQVLNLEKYIEHTILKPEATIEEVKTLLDEAINYKFIGVCINPVYVRFAKEYLKDNPVKVVTVIGFPLGASLGEVKAFEAEKAVEDGADELDMVINIGAIKDKDYKKAEEDIKQVVNKSGDKVVKVILETDLLKKEEIVEACKLCISAGADFVKTSTGFVNGGVGATVDNVKLMYETVSPYGLQVKASGGVRDKETAINMIKAGAVRIGTSSGVKIVS